MKRIARTPFFLKWVFPIIWFGILALGAFRILNRAQTDIALVLIPVGIAVVGFVVMRRFIWSLADEVLDSGEFLLVRKGDLEQKIYLSDIVNIDYMRLTSPPRVTILCRTPGPLGTEVAFIAPITFNPFKKPRLIQDLIERVDRASFPKG